MKREVSKEEFYKFVAEYPRELHRGTFTASEPMTEYYSDETLGEWPKNIVASFSHGPGMSADTTPMCFTIHV